MGKIFIAFGGRSTENETLAKKNKIANNFIIYNLQSYQKEEFQKEILTKGIILPHLEKKLNIDCFEEKEIKICRGMFINIPSLENYQGYIFLLNLFFNHFFNPIFYIDRLGYNRLEQKDRYSIREDNLSKDINHNLFDFLKIMQEQSIYSNRDFFRITDRVKHKKIEKFRLIYCISMYQLLKEKYSYGKDMFLSLSEMSDISIILEGLCTEQNEKESIGRMLRKRLHALIGKDILNIEDDIKYLYEHRSNFVHGNIYGDIIKSFNNQKDVDIVQPRIVKYKKGKIKTTGEGEDIFKLSKKYTSILRRVIIYYLYLDLDFGDTRQGEYNNIIELLDESLFDIKLKKQIEKKLNRIKKYIRQYYPDSEESVALETI